MSMLSKMRRVGTAVAMLTVVATSLGGSPTSAMTAAPADPAASGSLRVESSPALPTQILVDGNIADSSSLTWEKEAPGAHMVCFAHVDGWTEPACENVTVSTGVTTKVTGNFTQRGSLRVINSPVVASAVSVDGKPTNDLGMKTDIPTGSHTVCWGAVVGWDPPACQNVTVTAGAPTTVTGKFTKNPSAVGQTGVGLLHASTSPAVPSQITIQAGAGTPYIADSWGLNWLELAPGSYTVSFTHMIGWTEPPPQAITITAGVTTNVTGAFKRRGTLRVQTSPATPATILVDGIRRDDWGMWTDIPTGSHTVCFGSVPGITTPPCQTVTVSAGVQTDVTGNYGEGGSPAPLGGGSPAFLIIGLVVLLVVGGAAAYLLRTRLPGWFAT